MNINLTPPFIIGDAIWTYDTETFVITHGECKAANIVEGGYSYNVAIVENNNQIVTVPASRAFSLKSYAQMAVSRAMTPTPSPTPSITMSLTRTPHPTITPSMTHSNANPYGPNLLLNTAWDGHNADVVGGDTSVMCTSHGALSDDNVVITSGFILYEANKNYQLNLDYIAYTGRFAEIILTGVNVLPNANQSSLPTTGIVLFKSNVSDSGSINVNIHTRPLQNVTSMLLTITLFDDENHFNPLSSGNQYGIQSLVLKEITTPLPGTSPTPTPSTTVSTSHASVTPTPSPSPSVTITPSVTSSHVLVTPTPSVTRSH